MGGEGPPIFVTTPKRHIGDFHAAAAAAEGHVTIPDGVIPGFVGFAGGLKNARAEVGSARELSISRGRVSVEVGRVLLIAALTRLTVGPDGIAPHVSDDQDFHGVAKEMVMR